MICRDGLVGTAGQTTPTNGLERPLQTLLCSSVAIVSNRLLGLIYGDFVYALLKTMMAFLFPSVYQDCTRVALMFVGDLSSLLKRYPYYARNTLTI